MKKRIDDCQIDCATGLIRPKTTALFFDKLWVPYYLVPNRYIEEIKLDDVPQDIKLNLNRQDVFGLYQLCGYGSSPSWTWREMMHQLNLSSNQLGSLREMFAEMNIHFNYKRNCNLQLASNYIYRMCGIRVVPIFLDETEFEKLIYAFDKDGFNRAKSNILYEHKDDIYCNIKYDVARLDEVMSDGYKVVLDSIPIAIEDELSWAQVKDIRSDNKSFKQLKDFHKWASNNFKDKSKNEIEDLLGNTVEEYKTALKKFGVKTAIGGFTSCVSSIGALLGALGNSKLAITGAILTISTTAFTYLYGIRDDIKATKGNPIAYYYNILNGKI